MKIRIDPAGAFSLLASASFLESFTPLSGAGARDHTSTPAVLRLAFPGDHDGQPVGVRVEQAPTGQVIATITGGADRQAVRAQLARILSLDVDARRLPDAVAGDPVADALLRSYPSLRPVLFGSPYEAAAWCILSHRVRMTQAAAVRSRLCQQLGTAVQLDDQTVHAFPGPQVLRAAGHLPGVPEVRLHRLHAIADAAIAGHLDAAALRAAGPEQALTALQRLPGIGPFSAELILVRGAGEPDHFPRHERRMHHAMADAYGVPADDLDSLTRIAASWAPFRSWIGFLFRARLSGTSPAGAPPTRLEKAS